MLKDNGHFDETSPIHVYVYVNTFYRCRGNTDTILFVCSDCIRFAFMGILQAELDDIAQMWNTHLIRCRRGGISGIPEELYNIPSLQGNPQIFTLNIGDQYIITGYEECQCACDTQDLQYCQQYSTVKPAPACIEFLELVDILMDENDWYMPNNCEESFTLYLNLINEFQ